jgi:hypothetical protein
VLTGVTWGWTTSEDLLFKKEELQSKEIIKELEKHLACMRKEIERRATVSINP